MWDGIVRARMAFGNLKSQIAGIVCGQIFWQRPNWGRGMLGTRITTVGRFSGLFPRSGS